MLNAINIANMNDDLVRRLLRMAKGVMITITNADYVIYADASINIAKAFTESERFKLRKGSRMQIEEMRVEEDSAIYVLCTFMTGERRYWANLTYETVCNISDEFDQGIGALIHRAHLAIAADSEPEGDYDDGGSWG